jgi:5-methyltetrahydrofolate--homocysteine methyltransferase
MSAKSAILARLRQAIVDGDPSKAQVAALEALKAGIPAYDAIMKGMNEGMKIVGRKFERRDYFVSDLVMAAEAMNEGLKVLQPHLKAKSADFLGKIVIGSVQGDVHDIGKNLVVAMLRSAGFQVIDLGVDVSPASFIEAVKTERPQIVAASAYMSTTIQELSNLNRALKGSGLRGGVKFLIGGAAVSSQHVREVGADAYGQDALDAVNVASRLIRGKPK